MIESCSVNLRVLVWSCKLHTEEGVAQMFTSRSLSIIILTRQYIWRWTKDREKQMYAFPKAIHAKLTYISAGIWTHFTDKAFF